MAVQSKSWEQVGEKFESIGTHLRRRFDEASEDAAADRAAFEKALRALLSAVEDTLAAAGKTARDPALRKDLAELAVSVREALLATIAKAGEQVSAAVRSLAPTDGKRAPARKSTAGKAVSRKPVARKAVPHKAVSRKPVEHKRASA